MDEIINEFLIGSAEGLDVIDRHLVRLEESPSDAGLLTEIFRALHSIKGTCGFFGFDRLERLTHAGENLLSVLRDGQQIMSPAIANALLGTVDAIREILATIERTGAEGGPDVDQLVDRLSSLADPEASEPEASEPDTGDPDPPRLGDLLVSVGAADRDDVEIAAAEQALGDQRPIGEILIDSGQVDANEVQAAVADQAPATSSIAESTIRVDVGLLDRLMNLVGELVLSRNEIIQLASGQDDHGFGRPAQRLDLITSELQDGIMKTRMQPVNAAWTKLPRIVRDVSHQLGKKMRVEMHGRETELDRTIIEAIKDPLTHIVRNSVDHGVETPEQRQAAGKDPIGTLTLSASHSGELVTIEISDDGRGIDTEKVKAKAIERNLIDAEEAATMSEAELVQLVFRPGFSTAETVTNVSGRGVGMDVVKANVERIGGSVDVTTKLGEGSTFAIKIPLTLAIIPALTVRCADSRYAIPQMNLLELVRLGPNSSERLEDIHGAPVYRLRGQLLPIVDLRQQLELPPIEQRATNIVVVENDGLRFGLVVDGIEDNGEIVVKPLGGQVKDLKLFSGATIMGDGRVALILDLLGLADRAGLLGSSATIKEIASENIDRDQATITLDSRAMVVLSVGEGERVAVNLADVDRLEEFAAESIERSEGRPVIQYRGSIMPIIELGQVIGLGGSVLNAGPRVNVVVCEFGDQPVGLAVDQILDIVHSDSVRATASEATVIIDDLVTDVVSPASLISVALPSLQRIVEQAERRAAQATNQADRAEQAKPNHATAGAPS